MSKQSPMSEALQPLLSSDSMPRNPFKLDPDDQSNTSSAVFSNKFVVRRQLSAPDGEDDSTVPPPPQDPSAASIATNSSHRDPSAASSQPSEATAKSSNMSDNHKQQSRSKKPSRKQQGYSDHEDVDDAASLADLTTSYGSGVDLHPHHKKRGHNGSDTDDYVNQKPHRSSSRHRSSGRHHRDSSGSGRDSRDNNDSRGRDSRNRRHKNHDSDYESVSSQQYDNNYRSSRSRRSNDRSNSPRGGVLSSLTRPFCFMLDGVNIRTVLLCMLGMTMVMKLNKSPPPPLNDSHGVVNSPSREGFAAAAAMNSLRGTAVVSLNDVPEQTKTEEVEEEDEGDSTGEGEQMEEDVEEKKEEEDVEEINEEEVVESSSQVVPPPPEIQSPQPELQLSTPEQQPQDVGAVQQVTPLQFQQQQQLAQAQLAQQQPQVVPQVQQFLNAAGQIVDANGQLIQQQVVPQLQPQLVPQVQQFLNAAGQIVDANGQLIQQQVLPQVQAVPQVQQFLNAAGQIVDANGQLIVAPVASLAGVPADASVSAVPLADGSAAAALPPVDSEILGHLNNMADAWEPYASTDIPMFWHIPKAGGSSIKDAMGSCHRFVQATEFGVTDGHIEDTEVAVVFPAVPGVADTDRSPFVNIDSTTVDGIARAKNLGFADAQLAQVVVSPFVFELNELFTQTAKGRLFTIFRHPIDRAVSMFYYIRVADWEPSYSPELKDWTLEQYAASDRVENNWMTRFLSNQLGGELTEENLQNAMQVVRTKFLVGLMSQIERSMTRFEKVFQWKYHVNPPNQEACRDRLMSGGSNSNAKNKKKVEEGGEAWTLLAQQNNYDLQLYEYIESLFEEQEQFVTGVPDDFRSIDGTCCKCDPPTFPPEGFTCPEAVKNEA